MVKWQRERVENAEVGSVSPVQASKLVIHQLSVCVCVRARACAHILIYVSRHVRGQFNRVDFSLFTFTRGPGIELMFLGLHGKSFYMLIYLPEPSRLGL